MMRWQKYGVMAFLTFRNAINTLFWLLVSLVCTDRDNCEIHFICGSLLCRFRITKPHNV